MARLYFDHNVSRQLGPELNNLGHEVIHSQDYGLGRASDATHLLRAVSERRIFITNDADFLALQAAWLEWPIAWGVAPPPQHYGMLWVREGQMGGADQAARLIDTHLAAGPDLINVLWRWTRPRGWHIS